MTRTMEVSDTATYRQSPAVEHAKESPAPNSLELEKEEPVFIDIPLTSDPKVFKVFNDSIFYNSPLYFSIADEASIS